MKLEANQVKTMKKIPLTFRKGKAVKISIRFILFKSIDIIMKIRTKISNIFRNKI